jgi:hypothetical protein
MRRQSCLAVPTGEMSERETLAKLSSKLREVKTHLKIVVQTSERLDEDISALVAKLVAAGDEKVQRLVQIEVEMPEKVTANKLVDLFFRHRVQVLELVNGRKLFHVQPVWRDDIGLSLQQMLRLIASDVGHGGEHVREMRGCTFDAVAVGRKCLRKVCD